MESAIEITRGVFHPSVRKLIGLALEEDLSLGDPTTELTLSRSQRASAEVIAKDDLIVCGGQWLIEQIAQEARCALEFSSFREDGARLRPNEIIGVFSGSAHAILSLERVILNFLQHLSSIATHAHEVVKGAGALMVLDTRKTLPGYRYLEKYAVRVGGARNHRLCLGDMVLVKDNHIAANGGDLFQTLERLFRSKAPYLPVEVEVSSLEQVKTALEFPVQILLLDNMADEQVQEAVALIKKSCPDILIEVSGRVSPGRFSALQEIGVDAVSMGALTYGALHRDISLNVLLK